MKQNKPIEKVSFDEKFPTTDEITKLYMNQMQLGHKVNEILDYLFPEEGRGNSYQDGYDAGAAEASQVCSDMVVPQAYQQGREEMKVELRRDVAKYSYQGSDNFDKGYNTAVSEIENLLS